MESLTTDEVLTALKPLGTIQTLFLITSTFLNLLMPLHSQTVNFLAATPEHHCALRDGYLMNESLPLDDDDNSGGDYAQCREYVHPGYGTETQRCQNGWEFDRSIYGETIISEWGLVCGQDAASEISQSMYMTGALFGALIFGTSADRYGRRPTFLLGLIAFDITGMLLCASTSYAMFVVFRFLNGVSQMGTWIPFSGNVSEYMIPKYRSRAMAVPGIAYTFGLMLLALAAFLIRDWRYIQLAVMTPMVIGTVAMWYLPESLRWLRSKEREKKAEHLVRRLSKINGVDEFLAAGLQTQNTVFAISSDMGHSIDPDYKQYEVEITRFKRMSSESCPDDAVIGVPSSLPKRMDTGNVQMLSVGIQTYSSEIDKNAMIPPSDPPSSSGRTAEYPGEESPASITDGAAVIHEEVTDGDQHEQVMEEGNQGSPEENGKREASWLDIFRSPVLYVTVVLSNVRFTYALVYFGFALSTGRLAGDPYLNFFFSALVELPARILATWVYRKIRRTYVISACFFTCFIGMTLIVTVPRETKSGIDLSLLHTILALCGKFFITLTLAGQLLLVLELYPTTMRNMGHGWTTCMGRCGAILSPFMLYLDKMIWNFSGILMAVTSLITAVTVLTLPDTRRTAQPQTADDFREIMRSRKKRKKNNQSTDDNLVPDATENKGFDPDEQVESDRERKIRTGR